VLDRASKTLPFLYQFSIFAMVKSAKNEEHGSCSMIAVLPVVRFQNNPKANESATSGSASATGMDSAWAAAREDARPTNDELPILSFGPWCAPGRTERLRELPAVLALDGS
jgi:hypothetical protein